MSDRDFEYELSEAQSLQDPTRLNHLCWVLEDGGRVGVDEHLTSFLKPLSAYGRDSKRFLIALVVTGVSFCLSLLCLAFVLWRIGVFG